MAECPGVFKLAEARDGGLARIRVPGGALTAAQLRALAGLAREHGSGFIDLTHRANLQIRGLDPRHTGALADALRDVGLLAADPAADRLRNILASPLSGLDAAEIIDVRPHVTELDRALQSTFDLRTLSPKFSFVLDGGGVGRVGALAHDVGFLAEDGPDGVRYRLSLAGWPMTAMISPDDAPAAGVALAHTAIRLTSEGAPRMSAALANRSAAEVLGLALDHPTSIDVGNADLPREIADLAPVLGPVPERRGARVAYGLGVPLARLTDETASALVDLAERFGEGILRLAPWQAVFVTGLPTGSVDTFRSKARALELLTEPDDIAVRVVACSGSTGCLRTNCDTKADGAAVMAALAQNRPRREGPMTIHLSGCARGCAHPEQSDLLLLGRPDGGYDVFADARPSSAEAGQPLAGPVQTDRLADFVIEFANG
ncbi:MAG: precorrin-3B synthase [Methyloligellaceae bacterium]